MAMKKARISELKNRLSHYLRFVRRGESVLVLDRDRAIARIDPVGMEDTGDTTDWIADLERRGAVRRPAARLPGDWLRGRVDVPGDVVAALLSERESGR